MNIELIQGQFNAKDAIDIITQMIHIKIKFHESKISKNSSEEDIKMREKKIKQLQKDLYEARKYIEQKDKAININAEIEISKNV
ncbi:MAG: hypothetical protein K2W79_05185 [Hydrotalea flava]|uniref:hypothetical protein n=1 Tax=Hydrotalea sp. TaxID=2881279 RepID=UPI0025828030|nr:hypothetical protein [Hydrotalea sp.]MBY0347636.1 hypothetical protein [Hydrotalea flava]